MNCPICQKRIKPFRYWDADRTTGQKVYDQEPTFQCETRVPLNNGQALCHYSYEAVTKYSWIIIYPFRIKQSLTHSTFQQYSQTSWTQLLQIPRVTHKQAIQILSRFKNLNPFL